MWGISPEAADRQSKFVEKSKLTIPQLSDPDLAVIERYGILNEKSGKVPHPTTIIVDAEGTVRYVRTDVNYTKRPSIDELFEALDAIQERSDDDAG